MLSYGNASSVSKFNLCLRVFLILAVVVLLVHLFFSTKYLRTPGHVNSAARKKKVEPTFAPEAEEQVKPSKKNSKKVYTGYGEGCAENPYNARFKVLLQSWQDIAARQNIINYFICFGSMLGQSRNGEAVPYDHDVDICMFRNDLYKLDPEEEKRPFNYNDGTPHLIIQRHCHHPPPNTPRVDCQGNTVIGYTDKCAILDPCGRILLGSPPFLDIFAFKDNGEELFDEYKGVSHKREVIFPLRPCVYLGIQTKCPNNSTKYLQRYYGKQYDQAVRVCKDGKWVMP